MKTIVIPTDFSPVALNASLYAADMALAIDARLHIIHVYQIPISYGEILAAVNIEEMMADAGRTIDEIKSKIQQRCGERLTIVTEVRMGDFFSELKICCEEVKPYTVVMGSQGSTAAERLIFGNHAIYAMKHLIWPLITVPPEAVFSSIKMIGLACDFNQVVHTLPTDEIKLLVHDFNAELHVLNTGKKTEVKPEMIFESGLLQEMLVSLHPKYHFITSENTDQGIVDFAEQNHIDLLIVLPKRHSLTDVLIHRSHTKQLVLHSHVPVMALHHHLK